MKAKIEAGDVEGAVSYFITSLQQDYREAFTEAGTSLPLLSNYLNPLELVYANDNTVKCRMTRTEQINEQTQQIEYVLYFNKENGIWKLRDF